MSRPPGREERALGVLSRIDGPAPEPGRLDWVRIFRRSLRERTTGLVAASVSRHSIRVPRRIAAALNGIRSRLLAVHLLRSRDLAEALSALREIPVIHFKGLDLVERAYRMPGVRDMGDLDLLVPRERILQACEALESRGWRSAVGGERASRIASGRTVNSILLMRPERTPLHLHWHFANASVPLPYSNVPASEVFDRAEGGRLDPAATFVLLCEHALKHSFSTLLHLSDASAVWSSLAPDPGEVRSLARRWGLELAVVCTTALMRERLGTPVDGRLADVRSVGSEGRLFLRLLSHGHRWDGMSVFGYLSMRRGWREKWSFVRGLFSPEAGDNELFGKASRGQVLRRAGRALSMIAEGWRKRKP